jgi:hypothetical protein
MARPSTKPKPEEVVLEKIKAFLAQKDEAPAKEDKKTAKNKDVTQALRKLESVKSKLDGLYASIDDAINSLKAESKPKAELTPEQDPNNPAGKSEEYQANLIKEPTAKYGRNPKTGIPNKKPGVKKTTPAAEASVDDTSSDADTTNDTAEAPAAPKPARNNSKKNAPVAA